MSCLDCRFLSMGGSAITDFVLEDNGRSLDLNITAELKKVNINELFFSFKEFGQTYITSENLKGKGQATGTANVQFDRGLNVLADKIKLSAEVSVEKGELIKFEPLQHLSKFVDMEDLKHIYFSNLKNNIKVKNKVIQIPYMNVKSNALDLNMEGTHTFDNKINYKFSILLSELLFKKKKKDKTLLEHIVVSKEGKGPVVYLTMKGEAAHPEIKF